MSKKQQDYSRTYRSLRIGFRVFIIWRCLRVSALSTTPNDRGRGPFAIAREFCLKIVPRTILCGWRRTGKTGGAYRDRTDDPLLAKQVLSQLS